MSDTPLDELATAEVHFGHSSGWRPEQGRTPGDRLARPRDHARTPERAGEAGSLMLIRVTRIGAGDGLHLCRALCRHIQNT